MLSTPLKLASRLKNTVYNGFALECKLAGYCWIVRFIYRASTCKARYCFTSSVRPSVQLSNAGIVSKRLHIASIFSLRPSLSFLAVHRVAKH